MPLGDDGDDDSGNDDLCKKISLFRDDQCDFALTYCPQPYGGFINYIQARYCWFKTVPWLFYIVAAAWLLALFYMLSDTAEAYFSPALIQVSRMLKLSPNVAGITFLALGNGAPDISSIVAGIFQGSSGFGIAEPVGSGVFVTTAVLSAVVLLAKNVTVELSFLRDVSVYLVSVVFVFVCALTGELHAWQSITCLLIYVSYVLFVVVSQHYGRFVQRRRKLSKLKEELSSDPRSFYYAGTASGHATLTVKSAGRGRRGKGRQSDTAAADGPGTGDGSIQSPTAEGESSLPTVTPFTPQEDQPLVEDAIQVDDSRYLRQSEVDSDDEELYVGYYQSGQGAAVAAAAAMAGMEPDVRELAIQNAARKKLAEEDQDVVTERVFVPRIGIVSSPTAEGRLVVSDHVTWKVVENHFHHSHHHKKHAGGDGDDDESGDRDDKDRHFIVRAYNYMADWTGFAERNIFGKLTFFLEAPFMLVRAVTIPKADPKEWDKFLACMCPIFAPAFIVFALGYGGVVLFDRHVPLVAIASALGSLVMLVYFIGTRSDKAPAWQFVNVVLGFIMSVLWIYVVANELVDLLQSIGIMWRVSDVILATTVLAWGNSLGDLFADVAVARQGYPAMAIGAIFGGPCMNLLIGIGLSVTYSTLSTGKPFSVELDAGLTFTFCMLILSLLTSVTVIVLCRWRAPKALGALLLSFYVVYLVTSILLEFGVLLKQ